MNKNRFLKRVVLVILLVLVIAFTTTIAFSYFDDLEYTQNETTLEIGEWLEVIRTPQEFYDLATSGTAVAGETYYLFNDLDFSGFNWLIDSSTVGNTFSSIIEGNGYKIKNLTMYTELTSRNYIGMFGKVDDATFKNIIFENVHIDFPDSVLSNKNYRSGLIAGLATGDINVHNIEIIDSSVKATRNGGAGGLFGLIDLTGTTVTIDQVKSTNFKVFNTSNNVGSLIGLVENEVSSLSITNIDFQGELFSNGNNSHVGGIIGKLKNGATTTINNVIVDFSTINTIEDNINYINKYSNKHIGGIIGYNLASSANLTISNTFMTGELIHQTSGNTKYVGTLFGRNSGNYTGNNNYYAAVSFKLSNGTISYDYNPNAVGVFSIEVNNGTMPSVTWWNNYSSNFDLDIWSQDSTGRLYLDY